MWTRDDGLPKFSMRDMVGETVRVVDTRCVVHDDPITSVDGVDAKCRVRNATHRTLEHSF